MRCLLVFAAALVVASPAAGANRPHPVLDQIASDVAEKRVSVWCEGDEAAWAADTVVQHWRAKGIDPDGYADIVAGVAHIGPLHCPNLHVALGRGYRTIGTVALARALLSLAHESVHLRGVLEERVAECTALPLVDGLAQRYFGLAKTERYRAVVRRGKRKVKVWRTRTSWDYIVFRDTVMWTHRAKPAEYQC